VRTPTALVAVFAAGALLTACAATASAPIQGPTQAPTSPAGGPVPPPTGTVLDLAVPRAVLNLPLTDQDGKTVSLSTLRGQTVVVTPSLTLCQEFCPLISANFGVAERAVAASGLTSKVTFLEVTVDPQRDDLAHLKAYQGEFGAAANWKFLRGTNAQIATFWDAFHLSYGKVANDPDESQPHDWLTGAALTYDVDHQNIVYVLTSAGTIGWLTEAAPNVLDARLPDKLREFLDAKGVHNYAAPSGPSWTAPQLEQAIAFVGGTPVHSS
jgi:cytochrome oxidase Cu insertion factor (SCO1/SenC/PrrC family)